MAKSPSESEGAPSGVDAAIAELWTQMVTRDQMMWEQLTQRDTELQGRMIELFSRLLETNNMDRVLVHGFSELADQLKEQMAPLRELAPQRTLLPEEADRRLASLNRALARQNFGGPPESDRPFWIDASPATADRRSYGQ